MSLKKLLTAILTVSMVFTLVAPSVFADTQDDLMAAAVHRLQQFKIVEGDQNNDLHLGDTITRAEIMKVLVTALGKGSDAQLLRGAEAFTDTKTHWASGYIALAKAMGLTVGYPDGTFKPDNKITYGEIITLIDRAVGLDVSTQAYTWPNNYIHAAMDAGIIPQGIDATKAAGEFAIRSYVFLLADQGFLNVKLPSGKTVYQTYFVTTPPTLTVDQGASLTTSQDSVTISGSTNGVAVMVNDQPVALSNGTFSTTVKVDVGNSTINVVALDAVKNQTKVAVAVSRTPAAAASISVDLPASVTAGASVPVKATVKDSFGTVIKDAPVTGTCDEAVGTFDAASMTLTVAEKVGSGNCTFSSGAATTGNVAVSVVAGELVKITVVGSTTQSSSQRQTFTVKGYDQYGNEVTAPSVTWSSSAGVIDQSGNFAPGGATGNVTITAKAGDLTGSLTVNVFGAPAGVNLALTNNNIVANGSSTTSVTATVVDAGGNTVSNFSGTINFSITNGSVAYFGSTAGTTTGSATAANGTASLSLTAGTTVGSAIITASIPGSGVSSTTGQNVTLTTVAQTLSGLQLSASPSTIGGDGQSQSTISVTPVDQAGVQMATLSSSVQVTLTSSNTNIASFSGSATSTRTINAGCSGSNCVAKFTLVAAPNNGSTTISISSVTVGSAASTLTAPPITVNTITIAPPQQLAFDAISAAAATATNPTSTTATGSQAITIKLLDYAGNQVTNPTYNDNTGAVLKATATGNLKYWDGATWTAYNATTGIAINKNQAANKFTNGAVTVYVMNNTAETVTWSVSGTWNSGSVTQTLATQTTTSTFTPGAAHHLTLTATPDTLSANGMAQGTLTVKVVDATGNNVVTDGSYTVTITRTTNNGVVAGWTDQTVTTHNGIATVTITASTTKSLVGDVFSATATIGSTTPPAATVTVKSDIIGASNKLTIEPTAAATAGTAATIKVDVRDSAGTINTADNSTVVTLTLTGENNAQTSSYTATAANGVATFSVTLTAADTYDIAASASGLSSAQAGSTQVVKAASVAALLVKTQGNGAQPTTLRADAASSVTLVVYQADQYGNVITDNQGNALPYDAVANAVSWTCGGTTSAIWTQADNANCPTSHAGSVTVRTTTTPGVVTLTASTNQAGIASGSLNLTTIVTGDPNGVQITVGDPVTADGVTTQTVTVQAVDYQGNPVTNAAGTVNISVTSGHAKFGASQSASQVIALGAFGKATFSATNTYAETVTYSANWNGGPAATASGTFKAGTATHISVGFASPAAAEGNGSSIASVTASVLDAKGNVVSSVNGSIKFTVNSNYAYLQGNTNGDLTVPLVNGQATAILQTRNVTDIGRVGVTIVCVNCTDSNGGALNLAQKDGPGLGTDPGTTQALYVYPSNDITAVTPVSATYSAAASTITVYFNQPVKVVSSANGGWITTDGTLAAGSDFTIAQGSDAYHVVLSIPAGSNIGVGNKLNINAGATAAILGFNNVAPTIAAPGLNIG